MEEKSFIFKYSGVQSMKLLIIEDEKKVASFIKKGLVNEGFVVDVAHDGMEGLKKALDDSHNIIILDLMLPKMDGLTVLQQLRREGITSQIIILTAKGNVEDRIEGLNLGADDYLVKPFAFGELLARLRALLRRDGSQKNAIMKFNGLSINTSSREVFREGKHLELSAKEYALLEFMAYNANRALNRATISEHVWHYNFDRGTNFIDVYINRLRNKMDERYDKKFIHTVRGYGYMFKP